MTINRYRQIFGDKTTSLTDTQIAERIAADRQLVQSFIRLVTEKRLTVPQKSRYYGN